MAVVEVEVTVEVVAVKTVRTRIKAVKVVRAVKVVNPPQVLVIRGPSIRTCLLESGVGAICISDMAEELTFVRSRLLVPGRIFILQNLNNETVTSLAVIQLQLMTHCTIIKEFRK